MIDFKVKCCIIHVIDFQHLRIFDFTSMVSKKSFWMCNSVFCYYCTKIYVINTMWKYSKNSGIWYLKAQTMNAFVFNVHSFVSEKLYYKFQNEYCNAHYVVETFIVMPSLHGYTMTKCYEVIWCNIIIDRMRKCVIKWIVTARCTEALLLRQIRIGYEETITFLQLFHQFSVTVI